MRSGRVRVCFVTGAQSFTNHCYISMERCDTAMSSSKPVIGITADNRLISDHPYNIVQLKYITAISDVSDAVPLIIPAVGDRISSADILAAVDALLITGSASNVEPHHYSGEPSKPGTMHDPDRDDTTLPLIRAAVDAGVPLLAVCRGFQEMNVAFGGTLHQEVHEQADYDDHRQDKSLSIEEQYGPAHDVAFTDGGLLGQITGANSATLNSLHAIDLVVDK